MPHMSNFGSFLIVLFAGLIALVVAAGLIAMVVVPFTGIHIATGTGDHTGYITSVENTGLFWKTGRAYLKTSTQSTQEDAYCVIDPSVYAQLQADSVSGVQVNIHYLSWLSPSVKECDGEDAIIQSVTTL